MRCMRFGLDVTRLNEVDGIAARLQRFGIETEIVMDGGHVFLQAQARTTKPPRGSFLQDVSGISDVPCIC